MQNNLSKKIIIWSNEIFRTVDRTHVYKIDDDQLMRADVLLNFGCARQIVGTICVARTTACTTQSCSNTTE